MAKTGLIPILALAAGCTSPVATNPAADTCGASALQRLVGRPKSEIPPTPDGKAWRIACTTCPVTLDYSPQRLNIFYDEKSGIIRQVKCG